VRGILGALAVLMMLFVTGCSGGDPSPPEQPTAQAPAEPSPGAGSDGLPIDPDAGGAPEQEGATEAPQERSNSGPVLDITGLPAGSPDPAVLVDGAWCAVASTDPAEGVRMVVERIRTTPAGSATSVTCGGEPACLGTTLAAERFRCAVAVVPQDPPAPVLVAIDVRLECDTAQLCADYLARVGQDVWWSIGPPPEVVGPDGSTGDGTSGVEPGPGDETTGGRQPSPSPTAGEGGP
jgi:hypothetical protein